MVNGDSPLAHRAACLSAGQGLHFDGFALRGQPVHPLKFLAVWPIRVEDYDHPAEVLLRLRLVSARLTFNSIRDLSESRSVGRSPDSRREGPGLYPGLSPEALQLTPGRRR
jgi:hypothetical protein